MTKAKLFNRQNFFFLLYGIILLVALATRLVNLNYNSPFNDEAIYVVVGKMGVFQGDWQTYSASNWMAGNAFFYPVLAALSYVTGGIVGARFLNVIFGVLLIETIFLSVFFLARGGNDERFVGGLVAAVLAGGASVGYYTSRLATYDIPSFYFFFLGLALLLIACQSDYRAAKLYFLSVLSLIVALLFKFIVGIYFPFVIIYSLWRAKKLGSKNYFYWKRYFLGAFVLALVLYLLLEGASVLNYFQSQSGQESYNTGAIVATFWQFSRFSWFFWLLGTLGMMARRQWRTWLFFTLGAVWILVAHLVSQRWYTLDKHTFMTVGFLAIITGVGVSNLLWLMKNRVSRKKIAGALVLGLAIFWFFSYQESQEFNSTWENQEKMLDYLSSRVSLGDRLLVESGSAPILATYYQNFPLNVTTFDWFEYAALEGDEAYASAVKNGYFDLIQLVSPEEEKIPDTERVYQVVAQNLGDNYQLAYQEASFMIYERTD